MKYAIHNWFQLETCLYVAVFIERNTVDLFKINTPKTIIESESGLELACQRAFGSLISRRVKLKLDSFLLSQVPLCAFSASLEPTPTQVLVFYYAQMFRFVRAYSILSSVVKRESAFSCPQYQEGRG